MIKSNNMRVALCLFVLLSLFYILFSSVGRKVQEQALIDIAGEVGASPSLVDLNMHVTRQLNERIGETSKDIHAFLYSLGGDITINDYETHDGHQEDIYWTVATIIIFPLQIRWSLRYDEKDQLIEVITNE